MQIQLPQLSLVVLIGPSGSGKSTFARRHFLETEVLSSDEFRGRVSDDVNDQSATHDAFAVLHFLAAKRLARGRLTVIDATNVQPEARKPLIDLARQYHVLPVAILLNPPEALCHERNALRSDRSFGPHVVRQQRQQLRRSLKTLRREGFRSIFHLESVEQIDRVSIERVALWNDRRDELGPFDIIGDVHGCCDELDELLVRLGYEREAIEGDLLWGDVSFRHPAGRKAVFVGDLVDRGPRVLDVVKRVRNMMLRGNAICVPGNHDMKLLRKLNGKNVQVTHGLATSLAEIDAIDSELREPFCKSLAQFLDGLVSHYVLDGGRLVVAHAGMKEAYQGRGSKVVREFALYGETTGETDEFGLPVRCNWAVDYRGSAMVVYGHTPVPEAEWLNGTMNVDTGCVFGGKLSALRYPEREVVSVNARQTYCEPARPFLPSEEVVRIAAQHQHDDLLDAADVMGKRLIQTRYEQNIMIREENATPALEVISRFSVDPRWLIYLPPTMSPCETSGEAGMLEHPAQAFAYFQEQGVSQVICEEKHMGSRAIVVLARNTDAARKRFGITTGSDGVIYTRTGRPFFSDLSIESSLLDRLRQAMDAVNFWQEFLTDWVCLDCELMPWSAKAQELLKSQYAAVGSAGRAALPVVNAALSRAVDRLEADAHERALELQSRFADRGVQIDRFVSAYRNYCWTVDGIDDLKLAPFHLLATEGVVHLDRTHVWHMQTLAKLCEQDPAVLLATDCLTLDLQDTSQVAAGIAWWEERTSRGGEGMVVKPLDWIVRGPRGLVQPAIKCRGREYLRIIYGPDYDQPENLTRLRRRGLGRKRSLAQREFALGLEGLQRFVHREPLRRVHKCVFGVLALESEPVDPRL